MEGQTKQWVTENRTKGLQNTTQKTKMKSSRQYTHITWYGFQKPTHRQASLTPLFTSFNWYGVSGCG